MLAKYLFMSKSKKNDNQKYSNRHEPSTIFVMENFSIFLIICDVKKGNKTNGKKEKETTNISRAI
jgi:hypothetical protein